MSNRWSGARPRFDTPHARLARDHAVIVVDVRPHSEYRAGHIPQAVSIPLDELDTRINQLPADAEVVAYCRGPYCVLAVEAVALLRDRGRRARRLRDGLPEWRSAGLPVAIGSPGGPTFPPVPESGPYRIGTFGSSRPPMRLPRWTDSQRSREEKRCCLLRMCSPTSTTA